MRTSHAWGTWTFRAPAGFVVGRLVDLGRWPTILGLLGILCTVTDAPAAGFAIFGQGGSVAGNAYAGAAAVAEDPSTIFFNVAGMTRLQESELMVSGDYVATSGAFHDGGSFDAVGGAMTGGDGGAPRHSFVPSFYAVWAKPGSSLRLGLGVNTPFGQGTSYDLDWAGRYHAQRSELTTYSLTPSVAWRVSDRLSLGLSFNAQRALTEVSNAIDFGSACVGQFGAGCTALGLSPQGADGRVRISGRDWAYGFNAGLLYEPVDGTRFGIAYRSRLDAVLRGSAVFTVPAQAAVLTAGGTLFRDTGASMKLVFPESLLLGAYHELSPRWAVQGGLIWTRWSRIRSFVVTFDNPLQPPVVQPQGWDDTLSVAVGATFRTAGAWTFRAGVARDGSPIPDRTRSPRLPGSDAWSFSVGAAYRLSEDVEVDVAYQRTFLDAAPIDLADPAAGRLVGEFDQELEVASVQLRWRF